MKKFLLYAHGGAYNHGAEAIIKTTISLIRSKYPDSHIAVSSHYPEQDHEFGIAAEQLIAPDYDAWEEEKHAKTIGDKVGFARRMYAAALREITPDTILLSVGGDNYCYHNWHRLAVFQKEAQKQGAKSILWGASIEPSQISPEMIAVLNTYTHILARESITCQELLKKGVTSDIKLLPDIAFTLPAQDALLPSASSYVGVNISPLVVRKETKKGIIYENIRNMIDYALTTGYLEVALIPHVAAKADNDGDALRDLYETLPNIHKAKTYLVNGNLSASEYKFIISNCETLVCARTHASIAAYSSGVPTLTIGYSVKSAGIAADLNVPETVLGAEALTAPDMLVNRFRELYAKRDMYRAHFSSVMPRYIAETAEYSDYL